MELRFYGYIIIALVILRYTFLYWVVFSLGGLSAVFLAFYLILFIRPHRPAKSTQKSKFSFLSPSSWQLELEKLSLAQQNHVFLQLVFPESVRISDSVDEFIDYILAEFVHSWYLQISKSPVFESAVRSELHQVFRQLHNRLEKLDYPQLIVSKILPLINEHFVRYAAAEDAVKQKFNQDSLDKDLALARHYNRGKIHPAVSLIPGSAESEKKHLRRKLDSVLPLLLSADENSNEPALALVREILACTILANVIAMVTEGDFYNVLIVKLIGANLKHRDQVKQLRAALHAQTTASNFVTPETLDSAFKKILRNVSRETSIEVLTQLQKYYGDELAKPQTNALYLERLVAVEALVHQQMAQTKPVDVSLVDVLNNQLWLKTFSEFMEETGREELLAYYIYVDRIRAPLEDDNEELSLLLEFADMDDVKQIYNKFFVQSTLEIPHEVQNALDTFTANEKDIQLYKKARQALFKYQSEVLSEINDTDLPRFKNSDLFARLREVDDMKKHEIRKKASTLHFDTTDDDNDQKVSPAVVKAVEDAFTQIMKSSQNVKEDFYQNKSTSSLALSSEYSDGLDFRKFLDEKRDLNATSRLFDDSDESGTDSDSVLFESDAQLQDSVELEPPMTDLQVFLAAPGNLRLSEEITKLDDEIDNLVQQVEILQPLLRKAELTNNTGELKILKRSKLSLDREIGAKELQKQQYMVQENDNSLYGKSKVNIQSYISGHERGKDFILYIVEVQRYSSDDPEVVNAGWIVARRFSQFYKLHEYLKTKYAQVAGLKFPKRTMLMLNFQRRQLVELRKAALEEYLQLLIKIPEVCSNKAFRSFLSSENFNLRKNQPFDDEAAQSLKVNVEMVANKFYNGIQNRLPGSTKPEVTNQEIMENLNAMQKELRMFDEPSRQVFVKPICDFLISVFRLNTSKSWLRGRALIVILQQLFGTTIQKKVTDLIEMNIKSESNIYEVLTQLKNIVFPNGKFKDPPVLRTFLEQSSTKNEAKVLVRTFMAETCGKIFGQSNTNYASSRLFGMLQNDFLNKHLVFELIDEVLSEIFPEAE